MAEEPLVPRYMPDRRFKTFADRLDFLKQSGTLPNTNTAEKMRKSPEEVQELLDRAKRDKTIELIC